MDDDPVLLDLRRDFVPGVRLALHGLRLVEAGDGAAGQVKGHSVPLQAGYQIAGLPVEEDLLLVLAAPGVELRLKAVDHAMIPTST